MRRILVCGSLIGVVAFSLGWDAPGHRAVTDAAIDLLPAEAPSWLRDADIRAQIAFQSNEPDHYRGVRSAVLAHENGPEHYIDVELLEKHGLTLRSLPPLRYQFVAEIAKASTEPAPKAPEGAAPGTPPRRGVDRRMFSDDVGLVPYSIAEHYAKLVSSFNTMRMIERLADPARANELVAARANVMHEMGQLSHAVGDVGQPLHTTVHHHGWIGDNPDRFTTDRGFHAYVDGEVIALHHLDAAAILGAKRPRREVAPDRAFDEGIALIERSFAAVKPLYEMQRDGTLDKQQGRELLLERMSDAASVLAGMYWAAWKESEPTDEQVKDFVRYDKMATPAMAPATPPPAVQQPTAAPQAPASPANAK